MKWTKEQIVLAVEEIREMMKKIIDQEDVVMTLRKIMQFNMHVKKDDVSKKIRKEIDDYKDFLFALYNEKVAFEKYIYPERLRVYEKQKRQLRKMEELPESKYWKLRMFYDIEQENYKIREFNYYAKEYGVEPLEELKIQNEDLQKEYKEWITLDQSKIDYINSKERYIGILKSLYKKRGTIQDIGDDMKINYKDLYHSMEKLKKEKYIYLYDEKKYRIGLFGLQYIHTTGAV